MKKLFSFVVAALFAVPTFAQISDAQPTSHTLKTGNRPVKGTYGLYMGVTSDMFKDWSDKHISVSSLPILNFKYMQTDNIELRLGFEFIKNKTTLKGDVDDTDFKTKEVYGTNTFTPGFAYHFSPKNILDVYAGAELPIGWTRDKKYSESGDYSSSTKHGTFNIGLGGFVGLQAFIGHLPLALGVEYGLSAKLNLGDTYRHSEEGNGSKNEWVSQTPDGTQYDGLKKRDGAWGSQFRITLSYYFNK